MGQAVLYGFLRFIRVTYFLIELGDVGGDLLLGLAFSFAGEHLAALDSLLIEIPDDALPSSVCSTKDVAVGGESFLWHGAAPFLNHQHYRTAFAYVQTYVLRFVEKNLPAFWWIYTCLGRGVFKISFLCLCGANFEVGCADDRQRKKSHGHSETVVLIFLKVLGIL